MYSLQGIPDHVEGPRTRVDMGSEVPDVPDATLARTHDEVAAAIEAAEESVAGVRRTPSGEGLPDGDPGEPPAQ